MEAQIGCALQSCGRGAALLVARLADLFEAP